MEQTLGLYLHIPFCKSKCAYCDFYSLPHSEEKMDAYAAALLRHLEEVARSAGGREFKSFVLSPSLACARQFLLRCPKFFCGI